jgi:hypothetical protein
MLAPLAPSSRSQERTRLSSYVECVTWRQLQIGKKRRRLLGEDELSEKQQKSEALQNVHWPTF